MLTGPRQSGKTTLSGHPVVGASWEGFAVETLANRIAWPDTASFYRTAAGTEVDLVVDFAGGERWIVEVKRSLAARVSRGFHLALTDFAPTRAFVVHAGDDRYPLSAAVEAIGLGELAAALDNDSPS